MPRLSTGEKAALGFGLAFLVGAIVGERSVSRAIPKIAQPWSQDAAADWSLWHELRSIAIDDFRRAVAFA